MSSIDHIESLRHAQFVDVIDHLSEYQITEKLDGANIIFGLDEGGAFFTSRETKGGDRIYFTCDYGYKPYTNGFRGAHQTLQNVSSLLAKYLEPGDLIEAEILYGRQPNAIVYGSNYIVPIRRLTRCDVPLPVFDIPVGIVRIPVVQTIDGLNLTTEMQSQVWRVTNIPIIHRKLPHIDTKPMKLWLLRATDYGFTNSQLLDINLSKFPVAERPILKQLRANAEEYFLQAFKLPIKHQLVAALLHKTKSQLLTTSLSSNEDVGIEGVVLRHPVTGDQFKIVDKDTFTIINKFNFAVRNQIHGYGKVDTFGIKLIKNETTLNIVHDYMMALKTHFSVYDPIDPTHCHHITSVADELLKAALQTYTKMWRTYKLHIRSGKKIGYSPSVHQRTLLSFAETHHAFLQLMKAFSNKLTKEECIRLIQDKFGRSVFK